MIEYALLAGFISLVSVTWIINIGSAANDIYSRINSDVQAIP